MPSYKEKLIFENTHDKWDSICQAHKQDWDSPLDSASPHISLD